LEYLVPNLLPSWNRSISRSYNLSITNGNEENDTWLNLVEATSIFGYIGGLLIASIAGTEEVHHC
jgi:hypothetical protein